MKPPSTRLNVARHTRATKVIVRPAPAGADVPRSVTGNGRGMGLADRVAPGHFGLVGMQELAELLAAPLDIISAPGRVTTVLVRIRAATPQASP